MWGGVGGESSGHDMSCNMSQQTCPINFVHCTWANVIRLFLDRAVSEG